MRDYSKCPICGDLLWVSWKFSLIKRRAIAQMLVGYEFDPYEASKREPYLEYRQEHMKTKHKFEAAMREP